MILLVLAFWAAAAAPFTKEELRAVYYSDLGPDEIDISSYPVVQRAGYDIFRQACSRCHTPARAINSPIASREAWRSYVGEMRLRGQFTQEEARVIVDFLAFDGQKRKIERRAEFDELTRRLQRRYWRTVEERMRRLQESPRPGR